MAIVRGVPDWAVYAGGGVVLGGGYLLYKRRKATSASTTSPVSAGASTGAITPDYSQQQPSIAPYYLTGGGGRQYSGSGGGVGTTTSLPLPTPSGPPVGDTSTGTLPVIPPILPNVNTQTNIPQPAAPAPSTAAPTPAPAPTGPAVIPPDLLQKIQANGESIIGNLIDPLTGGTWFFGSKGGVFAVNGARYLGSIPGSNATFPGQQVVQAIPLGTGYRIVDSLGHTYNYGG